MTQTGSFRHEFSIVDLDWDYSECEVCGMLYEWYDRGRRGLPNFSSREAHQNYHEAQRKREKTNERLRLLFANQKNRCVCNPVADAEYLMRVSQEVSNKQQQDTGLEDNSLITKATPASTSTLGTTRDAVLATGPKTKQIEDATALIEHLSKLSELFNAGVLSKKQFEAAKNLILGI